MTCRGPIEGRALTWLGLAAYCTGEHGAARRLGEQARAVKRAAGLDDELSRSYNALGLLAWNEGRLAAVLIELGEFDRRRAGFEATGRRASSASDGRWRTRRRRGSPSGSTSTCAALAPPEALAAAQRDLLAGAADDPRGSAAYEMSGDRRRVGR